MSGRGPAHAAAAPVVALVAAGLVLVALVDRLGVAALALLLAAALAAALLQRPGAVLLGAVALVVLAEDEEFGLFPQTGHLYDNLLKGFTPIDGLMLVATAGVALQVLRSHRAIRLPPAAIGLPLVVMGLGLVAGVFTGRDAGIGLGTQLLAIHPFVYLALIPLLAVNVTMPPGAALQVLALGAGLALLKALLGLAAVVTGRGMTIEEGSSLTYYAPTANVLMTIALLALVAAALTRATVPRWAVASAPLLLLALALSYRRSFWIADALGLALVAVVAIAARGRHVLIPAVAVGSLVALALWALGGVALQSDTPLGERVQSLSPTKLSAKPDDRYRLDERANVLAELHDHPVTGLGLVVPWHAIARPLPVEVDPDHTYVHFATLFWWLRLGVLGLLAYLTILAGAMLVSWRIWRRDQDARIRAFGLGSLAGLAGLAVAETTATFVGSDLRCSILVGAHLGVLAVLARRADGMTRRVATAEWISLPAATAPRS